MMAWHARIDQYAWGRGPLGWRPDVRLNVGGGRSFGWFNVLVWTTVDK